MFIVGITMVIGASKIGRFMAQPKRLKGSVPFVVGVLLVVWGYTVVGMVLELFGFFALFGAANFLDTFGPLIVTSLRQVPIISYVLNTPPVKYYADRYTGHLPL